MPGDAGSVTESFIHSWVCNLYNVDLMLDRYIYEIKLN